jgi:hypothetical protein
MPVELVSIELLEEHGRVAGGRRPVRERSPGVDD